jgi:hypothetical protein
MIDRKSFTTDTLSPLLLELNNSGTFDEKQVRLYDAVKSFCYRC